LSATLASGGDEVVIFAVNDSLQPIARPLDFSAYGSGGQELEIWTLSDIRGAGVPDASNSFGEPERVAARRSAFRVNSPRFDFRFPPLSLSVLKWRVHTSQ
jgi:hypothetical protein